MTRRSAIVQAGALVCTLALLGASADDWTTPAEREGFRATPSLADTLTFLRRVEEATPFVRITTFGTSGAGRPLPLVVVDVDGAFTPERARAAERTVVLIQNGIHGGEIDGKDACLLLLRDVAEGRLRDALAGITLLIVPVLNADGHERVSPWNRPNQNGPVDGMGFRTNAAGLDLNRDHVKAETPEIRALLALVRTWRPHLHVDNHVTDGSDHAWVLTYSWVEAPQAPPSVDAWLDDHMPRVVAATREAGHPLGPYVSTLDRSDPSKGFSSYVGRPWYATGYWPLRNRPSILVENHAYKPYEARVRANHAFLAALLAEIARDPAALRRAVEAAEARTVALGAPDAPPSEIVLAWELDDRAVDRITWPVRPWLVEPSVALGTPVLDYRPEGVREIDVPWLHTPRAAAVAPRPIAYAVLPGRPRIERAVEAHGLRTLRLDAARRLDVEGFRVEAVEHDGETYQGRARASGDVTVVRESIDLPAGTIWIPADQQDFEVAVHLLEPDSPDSLFAWGMLASESERKEYIEPRVLERWVRDVLTHDDALAHAWDEALEDPTFAGDPRARWLWWYRRSPWWDDRVGRLPIYRVPRPSKAAGSPAAR